MKKTLFILSVSLFGFIGQHAAAQIQNPDNSLHRPAPVISLDEAIQLALANNPQIKRSLLAIKDANQLVRLAYSEVLPEITSSASYTRNIEVPVTFLPAQIFDPTAPPGTLAPVEFGTDNNWFGGLTVEQTIFRGEPLLGLTAVPYSKQYNLKYPEALRSRLLPTHALPTIAFLLRKKN